MGEWSDYFEDFPDENPANYVGNRFDPQGGSCAACARSQSGPRVGRIAGNRETDG